MRNIFIALGLILHRASWSKTRHYEIGGYLHSGSALVYEGESPAIYMNFSEEDA